MTTSAKQNTTATLKKSGWQQFDVIWIHKEKLISDHTKTFCNIVRGTKVNALIQDLICLPWVQLSTRDIGNKEYFLISLTMKQEDYQSTENAAVPVKASVPISEMKLRIKKKNLERLKIQPSHRLTEKKMWSGGIFILF